MAEITAAMVKDLREKTGAGMMDCKKALTESEGDFEKAVALLRERGAALAGKRSGRAAREGGVTVWTNADQTSAAILELNCETDFVARNPDFVAMLQSLAAHLGNFTGDPKAFPEAAYEGTTVADYVKTAVGRIGENLVLNRFDRITSDGGRIYTYVHPPYKIAVLVELVAKGTIQNQDALNKLGENLSLHVASAAPTVLHRDEIPAETIESERSIYRNQALNEGKPEAFVDKMVEGRLRKYFEAVVLSEQNFALDEKQSIAKLLEAAGKEIGSPVEIKSFRRYQLGEASAAATTED